MKELIKNVLDELGHRSDRSVALEFYIESDELMVTAISYSSCGEYYETFFDIRANELERWRTEQKW